MMLSSADSQSLGLLLDKKINTLVFKLRIGVDVHPWGRAEIPDGNRKTEKSEVVCMLGERQRWKISGLFWLKHRLYKRK